VTLLNHTRLLQIILRVRHRIHILRIVTILLRVVGIATGNIQNTAIVLVLLAHLAPMDLWARLVQVARLVLPDQQVCREVLVQQGPRVQRVRPDRRVQRVRPVQLVELGQWEFVDIRVQLVLLELMVLLALLAMLESLELMVLLALLAMLESLELMVLLAPLAMLESLELMVLLALPVMLESLELMVLLALPVMLESLELMVLLALPGHVAPEILELMALLAPLVRQELAFHSHQIRLTMREFVSFGAMGNRGLVVDGNQSII